MWVEEVEIISMHLKLIIRVIDAFFQMVAIMSRFNKIYENVFFLNTKYIINCIGNLSCTLTNEHSKTVIILTFSIEIIVFSHSQNSFTCFLCGLYSRTYDEQNGWREINGGQHQFRTIWEHYHSLIHPLMLW